MSSTSALPAIDPKLAAAIKAMVDGKVSDDKFQTLRKSIEVVKASKDEYPKLEKIILPPGMTYGTGARVLQEMEAS
mgnify:FL=1